MATCFPYMQNLIFAIIFIMSFSLIRTTRTSSLELMGLWIFLSANFVYTLMLTKDMFDLTSLPGMSTERLTKAFIMIVVCAFNIASSVMLVLTLLKLRQQFAGKQRQIELGKEDRKDMDTAEIVFISVVTFMAVMSVSIYLDGNQLFSSIYRILIGLYENGFSHFLRMVLPILALGVGSALYDKILTAPNNVCDFEKSGENVLDSNFNTFRKNFVNTYWLLFGVFMLFVSKYLADSWVIPQFYAWKWINTMNPAVIALPSFAWINPILGGIWYAIESILSFRLQKDEMQTYVGGLFISFLCIFTVIILWFGVKK